MSTLKTSDSSEPMAADDSSSTTTTTFVDYVPPKTVEILPPAKYKLWLIVFVLVYIASWLAAEAELLQLFRSGGWLSPGATEFIMLACIVFVLIYTTLDLVTTNLFAFQMGDKKSYGIGPWLKQPRAKWPYKYNHFLAELCAGIIKILEDGFAIFDGPPETKGHSTELKHFSCPKHDCRTILKIEHRVNPEKIEEYNLWKEKVRGALKHAHGLLDVQRYDYDNESIDGLENDVTDVEMGPPPTPQIPNDEAAEMSPSKKSHLRIIVATFANVDYLNEWMLSRRRQVLIEELQPLLVQPDVVQTQKDRKLPDAFTDLLTRQGQAVPQLPPKKWKVWWLTTVALFVTKQWADSFLPYYHEQWGLDQTHERLRGLVDTMIITLLNSYVMTPLMLFFFDPWVKRQACERTEKEPWKTLEDGFTSIWWKVFLTLALYGGCSVAWILRDA
jgi:antibiotic biosynthesis monooxygenase (ABM) superfamily enzyme